MTALEYASGFILPKIDPTRTCESTSPGRHSLSHFAVTTM
jgi:hypothetical protein